jgi:hypothetical protein
VSIHLHPLADEGRWLNLAGCADFIAQQKNAFERLIFCVEISRLQFPGPRDMPEIENSIQTESAVPPAASVREMRFDPAHEVARGDGELPPALSQPVADSPAAHPTSAASETAETSEIRAALLSETNWTETDDISPELIQQFRLQAQQLAAHLENRQRDLDRREAELHARIAQQESVARSSRLWFQERNNELSERQAQLNDREQQFRSQLADFDQQLEAESISAQRALNQQPPAQTSSTAHDELVLRDLDLQRQREELNEFALQLAQHDQECQSREQQLAQREQQLEEAAAKLARSQVESDDRRRQNQQQTAEIHARRGQQQARTIEQYRHNEIDLEKQRDVLTSRAEHLERRSAALDQMRSDLLRIQRETLEMRLATEELWAQMSGVVPPASITQSLARLRAQLAENFRLQANDAAMQRTEAEELAAKVAQQHQRLAAQKCDWQQWAAAQHRQIEAQAARLVAREEQLQREVERLHQSRQEWETQRQDLESEIRHLQNEMRHRDAEHPLNV